MQHRYRGVMHGSRTYADAIVQSANRGGVPTTLSSAERRAHQAYRAAQSTQASFSLPHAASTTEYDSTDEGDYDEGHSDSDTADGATYNKVGASFSAGTLRMPRPVKMFGACTLATGLISMFAILAITWYLYTDSSTLETLSKPAEHILSRSQEIMDTTITEKVVPLAETVVQHAHLQWIPALDKASSIVSDVDSRLFNFTHGTGPGSLAELINAAQDFAKTLREADTKLKDFLAP